MVFGLFEINSSLNDDMYGSDRIRSFTLATALRSMSSRVTRNAPPEVDPELARISEGMTTRLFRIEVDVRFPGVAGGERALSLATVRLAGKDLPQ